MADQSYHVPVYRLDATSAWPEVPRVPQEVNAELARPVVGVMMALAYRLKGARFPGALGDISPAKFFQEISDFAKVANLNRDTMVRWADSLNLDPTVTAPDDCVPSYMPILGFTAKPYQVLKAAWAARRMGSVLAMGCGPGK